MVTLCRIEGGSQPGHAHPGGRLIHKILCLAIPACNLGGEHTETGGTASYSRCFFWLCPLPSAHTLESWAGAEAGPRPVSLEGSFPMGGDVERS